MEVSVELCGQGGQAKATQTTGVSGGRRDCGWRKRGDSEGRNPVVKGGSLCLGKENKLLVASRDPSCRSSNVCDHHTHFGRVLASVQTSLSRGDQDRTYWAVVGTPRGGAFKEARARALGKDLNELSTTWETGGSCAVGRPQSTAADHCGVAGRERAWEVEVSPSPLSDHFPGFL